MNEKNAGSNSLAKKLNIWHLGRMFWSFVEMDIIITLVVCFVFLYCRYGDLTQIDYRSLFIIDRVDRAVMLREDLQRPAEWLFLVMQIVGGLQICYILTHIGSDAKAIKRKLRPIAELTQTAKNISAAGFSSGTGAKKEAEALRRIAGAISSIDVDQLDQRISVSEKQHELKELASAINDMLERIDQAYRAQIRFVSDASHELRTPIAVIQGYVNLLDRWGKNDEKALAESIDAIKSEADHMKNLIEQLLFLARGDADTLELRKESVDLSALSSEILRETGMIDPNHTFSSDLGQNIYAFGDEQLIKQAVRIFVDNSIKYTPYGEEIKISTRMQEDRPAIVIQDSGIGIPAADVPFVFDRFFRADESRARKTGGTGLGMAIAKWIIDRHEGGVEVLSRKEFGTRITVRFPPARWEGRDEQSGTLADGEPSRPGGSAAYGAASAAAGTGTERSGAERPGAQGRPNEPERI